MQTANHVPPAVVVFDPAAVAGLQNKYFGLDAYDRERAIWSDAFDLAFEGRRYSPPAGMAGRDLDAFRRGYATGLDARETVDWEVEQARLAEYEATVTHLPWGSEGDYAEARMAWPSTWALD